MLSENWDKKITAEIYMPASKDIFDAFSVPMDIEIQKYRIREFPDPPKNSNTSYCYSIPKDFVHHGEKRGSRAEFESHSRLSAIKLPTTLKEPLWQMCFQGISYAGRSYRNARNGLLMPREHDLIVFNIFQGKYYVSLIEVKSTSDDLSIGKSDSNSIKSNRRSGQHQLRDHLEVIKNITDVPEDNINTFLFWPFLSKYTIDPSGNKVTRWSQDKGLHVFTDTFSDQATFNDWFYEKILCRKSIEQKYFDRLFERYIVLSCGIFVNEICDGMLALLTQQQMHVMLGKPKSDGSPTIVHGSVGTGKTLLIVHRLEYLHACGLLNNKNRALYICYWNGLSVDVRQKLKKLNIDEYVDILAYYNTAQDEWFRKFNKVKYRHIFMDECEALLFSLRQDCQNFTKKATSIVKYSRLTDYDEVYHNTYCQVFHKEPNDIIQDGDEKMKVIYGDLYYFVNYDVAKAFPNIVSFEFLPDFVFSKDVRNTKMIYIFMNNIAQNYNATLKRLKIKTLPSDISHPALKNCRSILGHNINGPPIFWINSDDFLQNITYNSIMIDNKSCNALVQAIVDLISAKGIKPHDLCVNIFFNKSECFLPENINIAVASYFVENSYTPIATNNVNHFLEANDEKLFLITNVKEIIGLEFKVVVMVVQEDCINNNDLFSNYFQLYFIASRCTCLLILIGNERVKREFNIQTKRYPFNEKII